MSVFLVFICQQPKIIEHPKDQSVASGKDVTLEVEATGDSIQFQWQRNRKPLTDGDSYYDTNKNILHIVKVVETARYRCHVNNKEDVEGEFSKEVTLTVRKLIVFSLPCIYAPDFHSSF